MKEFNYGGQAVIEGVMMRGSRSMAVAVRAPSGEIVVHTEPLTAGIYTKSWGKWPIVRGLTMLWDSLGLGMRTLMFSADVAMGEEDVKFEGPAMWGTVVLSMAIAIGVFFLLPSAVVKLLDNVVRSDLISSLIEGLVRILLFLGYVILIGKWEDIRRVFAYHGAEHKTINAYEAGVPLLEPDAVEAYSTSHTRCGTSFLLIVLVISILIFAPFRFDAWHWRLLSRLLLIPLVAGISYEFLKLSARFEHSPIVRTLISPGLQMQKLTTRQPDRSMLEVAIAALKAVLTAEAQETISVSDQRIPAPETPNPA